MNAYKESADLLKFAKEYKAYEAIKDLSHLEDLEIYIYSVKNHFIQKEHFPEDFVAGYELLRKEAEKQQTQSKKYSREKYMDSDE